MRYTCQMSRLTHQPTVLWLSAKYGSRKDFLATCARIVPKGMHEGIIYRQILLTILLEIVYSSALIDQEAL